MIFHLFFWHACDILLLFLILHPLTPTSFLFFFFFFNPTLSSIDAILGAELLWCVVFPAGHVTGLCYLKHDAALGGVGGGVSVLQCYRAKNRNGSFMEGERDATDCIQLRSECGGRIIPLFNYATLASDVFLHDCPPLQA